MDDARAGRGEQLADNESGIARRATERFEDALASVKPGIDAAMNMLRGLASSPTEFELEFGLKLDAAAGALFAKVGAEATFNIKLVWSKTP